MSDYERNVGKLVLVGDKTMSIESRCQLIADKHGWEKHGSWVETVEEEGYRSYIIYAGNIYHIEENKELDTGCEFYDATKNKDGSINYHIMFYNGGCSLSEAIEEALKRLGDTNNT